MGAQEIAELFLAKMEPPFGAEHDSNPARAPSTHSRSAAFVTAGKCAFG
jgi:hypothetical protein